MRNILLKISDGESTIHLGENEEWNELFFIKNDIEKNKVLKKYFFEVNHSELPNIVSHYKPDNFFLIEDNNLFQMKFDDDCPYLEKICDM